MLYRVELHPVKMSVESVGPSGAADQQVASWGGEEVRQWLAGLGVTSQLSANIDGARLGEARHQDLRDWGLSEAEAEKIVEELKLVCDSHKDIPNEFLCPITCDIMSDPVKCSDGFVYERIAIKEWLMTRRNTSPMTNLEMTDASLSTCDELRQRIRAFLEMR